MAKPKDNFPSASRVYPIGVPMGESAEDNEVEIESPLDTLTPAERAFVEGFCLKGNAAAAAYQAGYSGEVALTAAHTLLRKPHIRQAVRAMRETQRETHRQKGLLAALEGQNVLLELSVSEMVGETTRLNAAARLLTAVAVPIGKDMSDDLMDDSAVEAVPAEKARLAEKEVEAAASVVIEERARERKGD